MAHLKKLLLVKTQQATKETSAVTYEMIFVLARESISHFNWLF